MTTASPLSGRQRLAVLAVVLLGLIGSGFQLGVMPLVSLSVSRDLLGERYNPGLAGDWFARYTAAIMLGAALGGILFGSLGDRVGRSRSTALSILCSAVFGAAGGFVTNQEQLLALRFLAGLGVGGMWPNGVALVAECWTSASRPMVAGIIATGVNFGILCISQLGRVWTVSSDSWRWLLELGGVFAALGLIALLFLPESPAWRSSRGRRTQEMKTPLHELFRPPLLRLTLVGIALGAIPLIGAWAASKWMIPWADQVGGSAQAGYKAATQGWWALGAILGSFCGSHVANLCGRRTAYFAMSLGATVLTCGIFLFSAPLQPSFLPLVLAQGFVGTLFFGWLPLYLPELFPTRVRATGVGIAFNTGRFASAAGVLGAGALMVWSGGDYAKVGAIAGLIYAFGMIVIWWAPDTGGKPLET